MYNLKEINFGTLLKEYRKSRNLTLEELGKKIGKTKATISKYEKTEIIPDTITLLEICNALNISLSQLFPIDNRINSNNNALSNPFKTNKLYLYYYTGSILIKSILEINTETNELSVRFYNGIKNYETYAESSSYYYEGILEYDKTIGYINLSNPISQNVLFEKIQISFPISWSREFVMTNFFIIALTPNSIPVIKKGIISSKIIEDFSKFQDNLKISQIELNNIQKNNAWILEKPNYDHFYFTN